MLDSVRYNGYVPIERNIKLKWLLKKTSMFRSLSIRCLDYYSSDWN